LPKEYSRKKTFQQAKNRHFSPVFYALFMLDFIVVFGMRDSGCSPPLEGWHFCGGRRPQQK
jgi:hypothetical protein